MGKNNDLILTNFLRFGLSVENISKYDVLVLPENFDSANEVKELIESSEALTISKIFKQNGIKCGNSFDLGFDVPTLERRAADIWLGEILIINSIALPFVINIISSFAYNHFLKKQNSKPSSEIIPKEGKVHLNLQMHRNGIINKLDYDGDAETLIRLLNSLKNEK